MDNETSSAIELGWNILYGIVGAIVGAIGIAVRFTNKINSFVTRDELERNYARRDQVEDLKEIVQMMDERQEDRHNELVRLIVGGKQ